MVNGIGTGGGGLGRQAIEAALQRMHQKVGSELPGARGGSTDGAAFADAVQQTLAEVDASVQRSETLHVEAVQGALDLHEVTAQLKQSELSFQFAMQVRNKFVDAYREVMRMSV